jgi:hypothetical protein
VDFSPSDKDHRRIAEVPTVVVVDDQPQQKVVFAVAAKDPEKVFNH